MTYAALLLHTSLNYKDIPLGMILSYERVAPAIKNDLTGVDIPARVINLKAKWLRASGTSWHGLEQSDAGTVQLDECDFSDARISVLKGTAQKPMVIRRTTFANALIREVEYVTFVDCDLSVFIVV